jgi:hypothetical protein
MLIINNAIMGVGMEAAQTPPVNATQKTLESFQAILENSLLGGNSSDSSSGETACSHGKTDIKTPVSDNSIASVISNILDSNNDQNGELDAEISDANLGNISNEKIIFNFSDMADSPSSPEQNNVSEMQSSMLLSDTSVNETQGSQMDGEAILKSFDSNYVAETGGMGANEGMGIPENGVSSMVNPAKESGKVNESHTSAQVGEGANRMYSGRAVMNMPLEMNSVGKIEIPLGDMQMISGNVENNGKVEHVTPEIQNHGSLNLNDSAINNDSPMLKAKLIDENTGKINLKDATSKIENKDGKEVKFHPRKPSETRSILERFRLSVLKSPDSRQWE